LVVLRPREGVCGGAKFFGSALLQPARSVCVSPIAFSFDPVLQACLHPSASDYISDGDGVTFVRDIGFVVTS